MSLYAYMIVEYDYSYSQYHILFHEKKYTKKEFQEICDKARKKAKTAVSKYHWDFLTLFEKVLEEEYGFRDIDILECDIHNGKVGTYGKYGG